MRLLSLDHRRRGGGAGRRRGAAGRRPRASLREALVGTGVARRGRRAGHRRRRHARAAASRVDGDPRARTPALMPRVATAAARWRRWLLLVAFLLAPQRFAPLFAPLTAVRRAADLRPGEPADASRWRTWARCALAAAASTVVAVGLGHPGDAAERARIPAAVAHPGEHRPDLPAGGGAGGRRAAGRLRREADADRAVRLRAAADLREHHRRPADLPAGGAGGGQRHGHERAASGCVRWSCRWLCR